MKIELTIEIDELNNAFALATAEANASEDEANDQDVSSQRASHHRPEAVQDDWRVRTNVGGSHIVDICGCASCRRWRERCGMKRRAPLFMP